MKKWLVLLLAVAMVFAFAACGQEAPAPAPAPAPAEGEAPEEPPVETPQELTKVVVSPSGPLEVLGYANWLVAIYNGYFEEEGIDLVMIPQGGTDVCKMLEAGECDFAAPAPALLFTSAIAGVDLKAVYQHDCNNIFGFAVLPESGITSWADLNGKSIVTDAAWYYLSDPILEAAGVDVSSIDFVSAADERSVLLAANTVDAAFCWQKEWQLWAANGLDITYLDGEEVLPNTSNVLCCTTEYYDNPDNKWIIEAVGRALAKGTYFCEVNPEAATAITVHRWPTLGVTVADAQASIEALVGVATPDSRIYGECERDRWDLTLEWLDKYDIVDASLIDLDSLLHSSEFTDGYNNWDLNAVKAEAEAFDANSVENWTE